MTKEVHLDILTELKRREDCRHFYGKGKCNFGISADGRCFHGRMGEFGNRCYELIPRTDVELEGEKKENPWMDEGCKSCTQVECDGCDTFLNSRWNDFKGF